MIDPYTFIVALLFQYGAYKYYLYWSSYLQPRFINDTHRQLDRELQQARKKHQPTQHIINKIKALVRAELERG